MSARKHVSAAGTSTGGGGRGADAYLSPKDLADRWRCSRSQVRRIAERNGFTRTYLGQGRNGMVRYFRSEVEAYERSRQVAPPRP